MFTGICSVFLAVLPMGIAFATGTPLQGSLGWGLSVINGGKVLLRQRQRQTKQKHWKSPPEMTKIRCGL